MGNGESSYPGSLPAISLSGWRRKETVLLYLCSRIMKILVYVFPGLMLYTRILNVGTLEV